MNNWDANLPYVLTACRSTMQERTDCSPKLSMLGCDILSQVDLIIGYPPFLTFICPEEYVETVLADIYNNLRQAAMNKRIMVGE